MFQANRDYTVRVLNETEVTLTYLTALLAENQALYEEGSMLFNESKLVIEGLSNGAPPPINTTVDLDGKSLNTRFADSFTIIIRISHKFSLICLV